MLDVMTHCDAHDRVREALRFCAQGQTSAPASRKMLERHAPVHVRIGADHDCGKFRILPLSEFNDLLKQLLRLLASTIHS